MFKLFKIQGYSLYPLFKEGEITLCCKIFSFTKININSFVLFKYKGEYMIKKVTDISNEGYFVKGENPDSIDSRNFGRLRKNELLYKAIFRMKPFTFFK